MKINVDSVRYLMVSRFLELLNAIDVKDDSLEIGPLVITNHGQDADGTVLKVSINGAPPIQFQYPTIGTEDQQIIILAYGSSRANEVTLWINRGTSPFITVGKNTVFTFGGLQ